MAQYKVSYYEYVGSDKGSDIINNSKNKRNGGQYMRNGGKIKDSTQSKLGMGFEKRIETTNQLYFHSRLAVIQKIPTPTKNIRGKIVYSEKSTVDFMGVIGPVGQAIAFEAKETSQTTNFPLFRRQRGRDIELIPNHQRDFLENWTRSFGIAFVLIHFSKLNKCYKVPVTFIVDYYIKAYNGGRKSIPIGEFKQTWETDIEDYLNFF